MVDVSIGGVYGEQRRIYGPGDITSDFATAASDLTGSGNGGGSRFLNVNGSVTPAYYTFGPPSGESWILRRIDFTIEMTGDPDMSNFGDGSALSTGIDLGIYDSAGSKVANIFGSYNLKNNGDIYRGSYSHGRGGPGQGGASVQQTITGVYTFCDGPWCLKLQGGAGHKVGLTVADDLSGLDKISAFCSAHKDS